MGVVIEEVEASVERPGPPPVGADPEASPEQDEGLELKVERLVADRRRRAERLEAD